MTDPGDSWISTFWLDVQTRLEARQGRVAAGDGELAFHFSNPDMVVTVVVTGGCATVSTSHPCAPSVSIMCTAAVWRDIVEGRDDAGRAFVENRLQVTGDLALLAALPELVR
jgi:predicted lipid carrier protein YhbT